MIFFEREVTEIKIICSVDEKDEAVKYLIENGYFIGSISSHYPFEDELVILGETWEGWKRKNVNG